MTDSTLKEKIEEIVNHAVYDSGAGNDVLISNDIDNLEALFRTYLKKEVKEIIGEDEKDRKTWAVNFYGSNDQCYRDGYAWGKIGGRNQLRAEQRKLLTTKTNGE